MQIFGKRRFVSFMEFYARLKYQGAKFDHSTTLKKIFSAQVVFTLLT